MCIGAFIEYVGFLVFAMLLIIGGTLVSSMLILAYVKVSLALIDKKLLKEEKVGTGRVRSTSGADGWGS